MKNKNILLFILVTIAAAIFITDCIIWIKTINQPLFDLHSFRQTQTAVTAQWMDYSSLKTLFFQYKTPIFGYPWSCPFEFPFYQLIVSLVSKINNYSLEVVGRIISISMFLLLFPFLYELFIIYRLGKHHFAITSIFILSSPLYVYWSRTFMIESTALLSGFIFLTFYCKFLQSNKTTYFASAIFFGTLCALVKITTLPAFLLAGFYSIIYLHYQNYCPQINIKATIIKYFLLILLFVVVVKIWNLNADSIKILNPITIHQTSSNLNSFIFGNIEQRFSSNFWENTIFNRTINETLGGQLTLGFLLAIIVLQNCSHKLISIGLITLFLLPMLIFSNLHIIHSYYQYANAIWLLICLGISVSFLLNKINIHTLVLITATIAIIQWSSFTHIFWPEMLKSFSDHQVSKVSNFIEKNIPNNTVFFIYGDSWSPHIAYFSKRACIYIPEWLSSIEIKNIKSHSKELIRNFNAEAFIVRANPLLPLPSVEVNGFDLQSLSKEYDKKIQIGEYFLYYN